MNEVHRQKPKLNHVKGNRWNSYVKIEMKGKIQLSIWKRGKVKIKPSQANKLLPTKIIVWGTP